MSYSPNCNSKLPLPPSGAGVIARLSLCEGGGAEGSERENRKRREAYQEMMSAGATGLHTVS